jgi:hypothetical protein
MTSLHNLAAAQRQDGLGDPGNSRGVRLHMLPAGLKTRTKAPACPACISSSVGRDGGGAELDASADPFYVRPPDIPAGVTCPEWRAAHPPIPRTGLIAWLRFATRPLR